MSVNKFWFKDIETMNHVTQVLAKKFSYCDNFLTVYQLQEFTKFTGSEFVTSEKNKDLGFTKEEFDTCKQQNITTLPEQYELYFQVQPHTKPEVEVLMNDKPDKNRYCSIIFKDSDAWKKLRAEIDENEFYTVKTMYRIVQEDKIGFVMASDYISYEEECSKGWLGKDLINTLDNAEHYACFAYPDKGFCIYMPDVKEDEPSPERLKWYADKLKATNQKNREKAFTEVTSDKPTRQYILERAIETCCHDRQNQYGAPEDSFRAIAYLWDDYIHLKYDKDAKKGESIPMSSFYFTPEDISVMMTLMKIARQICGEGKMDNYVDGSAYLAIAGEMWSKGQRDG